MPAGGMRLKKVSKQHRVGGVVINQEATKRCQTSSHKRRGGQAWQDRADR